MSSKSDRTRSRILHTTCELLSKGAGAPSRMSDIAKGAGISRQALYLHFPNRADLLVAAARYLDEVNDVDAGLAESRAAHGVARLDAYIAAWGAYIPKVYGMARALMAMKDTDDEAAAAWRDRMGAMRHGCEAAVRSMEAEGQLREGYSIEAATDLLFNLISIPSWESMVQDQCWSEADWLEWTTRAARDMLVAPGT